VRDRKRNERIILKLQQKLDWLRSELYLSISVDHVFG